jgi:O-antigen ligase
MALNHIKYKGLIKNGQKIKLISFIIIILIISQAFSGVDLLFRYKEGGSPLSYTNIFLVIFALYSVAAFVFGKRIIIDRTMGLMVFFYIEILMQFYYVIDLDLYISYLIAIGRGLMMMICLPIVVKNKEHINLIAKGMFLFLLINSSAAIIQELTFLIRGKCIWGASEFYNVVYFYSVKMIRACSFMNDPNIFAAYLLVSFSFIIVFLEKSKLKILLSFMCFIIVVSLTFSRGALVAFVIWLIWYSFKFKTLRKNTVIQLLLLICIIISIKGVLDSGARRVVDSSSMTRFMLIKESLNISFSNLFLGVGAGNLSSVSQYGQTSHNLYLELSGSMGIIGLILFLFIILNYFKQANLLIRNQDETIKKFGKALLSSMFAYLSVSLFLSTMTNTLLWFLVALSIMSIRFTKQFNKV